MVQCDNCDQLYIKYFKIDIHFYTKHNHKPSHNFYLSYKLLASEYIHPEMKKWDYRDYAEHIYSIYRIIQITFLF